MEREQMRVSRFLAGNVKRYHTWPTITTQTVAAHCWRVACILVEVFGLPRAEVLYYALHHDSGEFWAGDIPFSVKQSVPGLREAIRAAEEIGYRNLNLKLPDISLLEQVQVKISDLLEMYEFGEMEANMGNHYAHPIVRDTVAMAQKIAADYKLSEPVNKWLTYKGQNP